MTDTFFDFRPEREKTLYPKINFMKFDYGQHLLRVIGKPVALYSHYLRSSNLSIKCLGDDCPICQNNKKIFLEHPNDFREVKGYVPRQYRHYFNGLDRTLVKVCPNCQAENKRNSSGQFPPTCTSCNAMITSIKESQANKVKLVNISDTNAKMLAVQAQSVLDTEGNILPLDSYDIMFTIIPGERKVILPQTVPANNDKVEVPEDALYDLNRAVIILEPEEIISLLKGVALRDIFAARSTSKEEVEVEKAIEELDEQIEEKIKELGFD
jgi:hypothetical protein